ncbi:Uncharacterized protein dnm_046470 [Desulfonema magnum]|uniref:Uncharacterized protein n=1 Tax=Desulfonema magnum TaxID=45655 RepID=A0A975BPB1_9BACT|nr:Uncharacterized protein dnm_046470 [Desulfonema magnum]
MSSLHLSARTLWQNNFANRILSLSACSVPDLIPTRKHGK